MKQFLRPACTMIATGLYRLSNAIGRLAMWFDTLCMDFEPTCNMFGEEPGEFR